MFPVRRDPVPVSSAQERFWFVDQLRPGTGLHNLAFGVDVAGELDTGAVERALTRIVRRHEVLRTRFEVHDGALTQRFAAGPGDVVEVLEVGDVARLEDLTSELAHRPFDYDGGPMLRMALLRSAADRHRLVLVAHHAVFDGWSLGVFLAEFAELYRAESTGRSAVLPELELHHTDYAVWESQARESGAFAEDQAYWTALLGAGGGSPPLEQATDFPRPARPRMRGRAHRFTVPAELAERVGRLAAEESATPFTAWLALFALLLHRRGGQEDLCVGGPVSHRPDERFEHVIGPFLNVLVFRCDLSGDPTFRELLGRLRGTVTGALAHQGLPLQAWSDGAGRPRGAGAPPFRAALAFQPSGGAEVDLGEGLEVRTFPIEVRHAQNDLSLFLSPAAQGFDAMALYDTDLFRADTVERLCGDLLDLARRLTRDPDLPLRRVRGRTAERPERAGRDGLFPLARQQYRWWAAERDRPGDPAWKSARVVTGAFDPDVLRTALAGVEWRHEVLRTRLCEQEGEPRLRIAEPGGLVLREHDLESEEELATLVRRVVSAPVDLTADAPVTADLARVGGRSVLLLAAHRFALDENSLGTLLSDLVAGRADEQELGFADYTLWQQRRSGNAGHRLGAPPVLTLPAPQGGQGAARLPLSVPAERLDALCESENVPLHAVVTAGLAVVLARYAGRHDLVIGACSVDRVLPGVAGCFTDVLPVRVEVREEASFRDLVLATAAAWADAEADRDVPAGAAPSPTAVVRLSEPDPAEVADANPGTPFDLLVDVRRHPGVLAGEVRYRADAVAVPGLAGHLAHLLTELAAHPDRPTGRTPTLPPAEHRAVLGALATPDLPGGDATLHGGFEDFAARTPDAPALDDGGREWTYRELNAWANRIAHGLMRAGVTAGRPVVLLMRNGPVAVAALLGVLKAGGAFACLDPRTPSARLEQVLAGLAPALVLTDQDTAAEHGALADLVLAEHAAGPGVADFAGQPAVDPGLGVRPGDLAYVAHTSGSTGRPKAIPHRHRDLAQFVRWQSEEFGIGPGARVGQLAAPAFDVAYCEIFGALCHGATLCLRPAEGAADPAVIGAWLHERRITLLQIIPRLFREVLRALDAHGLAERHLAGVRTVLFVGEALPAELVTGLLRRFDRLRPVNVYGPTEVVAATFHPVERPPEGTATVPVGRPVPGRTLVLCDEAGRLCPPGVAGEIWIGSRYLSDGYRGDEEQTRSRYRSSPFPELPGVLYRTGDLAVLRPDGLLTFVGRTDNQVKLSGVRVELEEVEAAVTAHPGVRECVAQVRVHGESQRLVVHVVADGPIDDLTAFLRRTAPPQLVPADVVPLESLPRNANGKVDRAALPEPPARASSGGAEPGTPLERHLAELAREVLGVDRVGPADDLFDLGGNSLQAARFVNRIRDAYGVDVPLQALLENPTVAATAAAVEDARRELGHADRLARIEHDLDRLSDDEVHALLARHRAAQTDHELEKRDRHGTVPSGTSRPAGA
ncbi:amino acid adenylation domain-containing protein [Lentzea fradiae]|uniref:Amino acid adenylation domain-containing protein n=1 Tax=Lentzea fradiae TaxID=200378 RepID=A0A1G8BDX8_9PSEU|nr:non-ribosomal peptide synthetase [Lentzea fradiae]SDH31274.1 amino acid adenylation domain-containing protein [Lentzea fradiae]